MKRSYVSNESGSALLSLIIIIPFILLVVQQYMSLNVSSFYIAGRDRLRTHAQLAADAGVDSAMQEITIDENWTGTLAEIDLHDDGSVRTSYEVSVETPDEDNKIITSVGRTFRPATNTTPESTVTLKVNLRPVRSGEYSIVSGVGGLRLSNNAKIVGGDVLVNGSITLTNNAQIGLTNNPVNVEVAHQNCPVPADATYPRVCNNGENGQPITITNNARIYGTVKANNQTTTSGISSPGLVASSGVSAQPLPPHDRMAQAAAVTTTQTGSEACCHSNQVSTETWPANLKVNGDVNISGKCRVVVTGDVWITGKLTISNQAEMVVADSLGAARPDIMVDGSGTAVNLTNSAYLRSNNQDTGFQVVTYWSRATCSPDCTNVTGEDLFDTRNDTTINMNNNSNAPETILYARWSKVEITNNGQIGALVGQTVELNNGGTITFGTSTGTGQTFWVISGYRRD